MNPCNLQRHFLLTVSNLSFFIYGNNFYHLILRVAQSGCIAKHGFDAEKLDFNGLKDGSI